MTPEPRLRSACGGPSWRPSKKRSKKSCMGSLSSSGLVLGLAGFARCVLELGFFSRTCVVAILTTAGSTRFTMVEKELAEGIGSGTVRGVAFVPLNDFIAETRPEITEPIMIPVTSVNATKNDAMILRRRAQLKSSFTCSPMSLLLDFPAAPVCEPKSEGSRTRSDGPPGEPQSKYNTAHKGRLPRKIHAPRSSLSQGTGIEG